MIYDPINALYTLHWLAVNPEYVGLFIDLAQDEPPVADDDTEPLTWEYPAGLEHDPEFEYRYWQQKANEDAEIERQDKDWLL